MGAEVARRLAQTTILALSLLSLTACEPNGAVVLKLPSGELYCQNDWDESEIRDRQSRADDVVAFRPGKDCAFLLYTKKCANAPKTFFHEEHRC